MTNNNRKTELLAPAGNMESLRAAVNNGADAVYLGARDFSARSKAANFDREELAAAVRYAHLFGVKVYLAINTILKPSEYNDAIEVAKYAVSVGVDAFIVQDLMFVDILHSTVQNAEIHLSTQCGIHNVYGAIAAKKLGATRVVLARETTIEDIKRIKDEVDIELECFVQGALCVSFSGNCYLSSLSAGLSGNRGKCLQLCRKKYSCGEKRGYLLSAKDIDLSVKLDELTKLGVKSFKIEGRMRKPEYVGGVTAYYRAILDNKKADHTEIERLFNRGDYCSAYLKNPTENVIYPYIQGHKGYKIGKVVSVNGKFAKLTLKKPLKKGDGIKFISGNSETGSALVNSNGYETTFSGKVKPNDEVYLTTDVELENKIRAVKRTLPVSVKLTAGGNTLIAIAEYGGVSIENKAEILETAVNAPFSEARFKNCFEKSGDVFSLTSFNCSVEGKFVAVSLLNEFRRETYLKLENAILNTYECCQKDILHSTMQNDKSLKTAINGLHGLTFNDNATIIQTDSEQADKYLPYVDYVAYFPKDYSAAENVLSKLGSKAILVLPVMIRGDDEQVIKNLLDKTQNVMINNIGHIELCQGKNAIFGPFMNVINPEFPIPAIMSPEYDGREYADKFVYAFGRFAAMTFAHCPNKTLNDGKCAGKNCEFTRQKCFYTDENRNVFPIRHYKVGYCYAQLMNCVPINALDYADKYGFNRKFIDLTGYTADNGIDILKGKTIVSEFTRGYFRRKLI